MELELLRSILNAIMF